MRARGEVGLDVGLSEGAGVIVDVGLGDRVVQRFGRDDVGVGRQAADGVVAIESRKSSDRTLADVTAKRLICRGGLGENMCAKDSGIIWKRDPATDGCGSEALGCAGIRGRDAGYVVVTESR